MVCFLEMKRRNSMQKICLGFVTLLLGCSLTYGYNADNSSDPFLTPSEPVVTSEHSAGLTPKRSKVPVAIDQQPAKKVPVPVIPQAPALSDSVRLAAASSELAPAVSPRVETQAIRAQSDSSTDAYIYAELERLSQEVQKIKKDTAKPDTKKAFSAPKIGGRFFFESYSMGEENSDYQNKAGLREFRLTLTGNGYSAFEYKAEIQYSGGNINFADLWVGAKHVPGLGYLRVGHHIVENSPAFLSGTTNPALTEGTPPMSSFYLQRRLGMSSEHMFANDRIRWFCGVFQGQAISRTQYISDDNQGYILNTRLSAAPLYADGGRYLLHLGGSYAYTATPLGVSSYVGGNNWLATTMTTGTLASKQHHRSSLELIYQMGPFSAHSEAFFAQYGGADKNRLATGVGVELTYFLTGEHRTYNLSNGSLGAAQVKRPFRPFQHGDWNLVDGLGAWQVVTGYSYVDLGDWREVTPAGLPPITSTTTHAIGGLQHDLTVGMSWFWNPNLRWTFAYTHSQQNRGTDYVHSHQDIFGVSVRMHW